MPEYDQCRAAAAHFGVALRQVQDAARAAYDKQRQSAGT
jgi:hypothetical protein